MLLIASAVLAPTIQSDDRKAVALPDTLFAVDDSLGLADEAKRARGVLARLIAQAASCRAAGVSDNESCALRVATSHVLDVANADESIRESTLTGALLDRSANCMAIAATAMAVAEATDERLLGIPLFDHFVLALAADPLGYLEPLERGRRIPLERLAATHRMPPDGPVRVNAATFAAYYLDNLAARSAGLGRKADAERLFGEAIELDPRAARINFNYGAFALQCGNARQAIRHFDRALRDGWIDADLFALRGVAYSELGQRRRAERDWRHALRLNPRHDRATRLLRQSEARPGPPDND